MCPRNVRKRQDLREKGQAYGETSMASSWLSLKSDCNGIGARPEGILMANDWCDIV